MGKKKEHKVTVTNYFKTEDPEELRKNFIEKYLGMICRLESNEYVTYTPVLPGMKSPEIDAEEKENSSTLTSRTAEK